MSKQPNLETVKAFARRLGYNLVKAQPKAKRAKYMREWRKKQKATPDTEGK